MIQLHIKNEWCKSCGFCVSVCPKKALSFSGKRNKQSYEYVEVDESKCIKCGSCYTVCPDNVFQLLDDGKDEEGKE